MKNKVLTSSDYIALSSSWREELTLLIDVLKSTELKESIKWGIPVYCLKNKNVVGVARFKNHVCLWFYQGVFLKDEHKLLINAQEGLTKGLRQMRFNSIKEIDRDIVKAYILEAIENQKQGKEITKAKTQELSIPSILVDELKKQSLETNFNEFTTSKRNEFIEYISSAKREETKQNRLTKIIPMIKEGVGLNDKYKK